MIGPSQRPLPDNTQLSQETDIHVPGRNRTLVPRSVNLFNIFINVTVECLGAEGTHALIIRGLRIPGLLYVDDLVLSCFTSCGLKKKIGLIQKYSKKWNLVCNMNKFKIIVYEKVRKLKATRAGEADNIDVLDKCNYLGAILENTEGGSSQNVIYSKRITSTCSNR